MRVGIGLAQKAVPMCDWRPLSLGSEPHNCPAQDWIRLSGSDICYRG